MRKFKQISIASIVLFLIMMTSSCGSVFYQVYEVKSDDLTLNSKSWLYRGADLSLDYNLWSQGGLVSFTIRNNTDKDIFIDLKQSFFIRNDEAKDYYSGVEYASSNSYSVDFIDKKLNNNYYSSWIQPIVYSVPLTTISTLGASMSKHIVEKDIICIPSKSFKLFGKFHLMPTFIITCDDDLDYPESFSTISKYDMSNSPLVFRNRLAYSFSKDITDIKYIENKFYLSEIINYSETHATKDIEKTNICEKEFFVKPKEKVFSIGNNNRLYLPFKKYN